MQRYIAFLRAINVGGHTVKMDRLRAVLESAGLRSVETFIASGNAAFSADGEPAALERRIERDLAAALGYDVATFLRTPAELAAAAAYEPPLPDGWPAPVTALSVAFLKQAPDPDAVERLLAHETELDALAVRGREVYWSRRTSVSDSAFSGARLERAIRGPATIRNVTTVRKLAARYPVGA